MRTKVFISTVLLATTCIGCSAPKTVDPIGNSKRLPIGRDKSIDRDTSGTGRPDTAVTDTATKTVEPAGKER
jgi:hypothetical protein